MPITKSKCKKPRRWIVQRTLRSRSKGRCQTFTKRHQEEPIRAITQGWVSRMCHNELIRSSSLLSEELRYHASGFIVLMLEEPNSIEAIRAKLPKGLKGDTKTEYALSSSEFMALVHLLRPDVVDENKLNVLHKGMEKYLHQLISKGAVIAKREGSRTLQPRHIIPVRLSYFPPLE